MQNTDEPWRQEKSFYMTTSCLGGPGHVLKGGSSSIFRCLKKPPIIKVASLDFSSSLSALVVRFLATDRQFFFSFLRFQALFRFIFTLLAALVLPLVGELLDRGRSFSEGQRCCSHGDRMGAKHTSKRPRVASTEKDADGPKHEENAGGVCVRVCILTFTFLTAITTCHSD